MSRPLCRPLSGQALCWRRCPAGLRPGLIEPRNTTAQTVHVCPSVCLSPSHTDTRCQYNRPPRSASPAPALRGAGGRQSGANAGNDSGTCPCGWEADGHLTAPAGLAGPSAGRRETGCRAASRAGVRNRKGRECPSSRGLRFSPRWSHKVPRLFFREHWAVTSSGPYLNYLWILRP